MNSDIMMMKYKLVPPDGGYGYVIVLAVVTINVANMSFSQSYGILFQNFYEELDMNTTNIVTQFSLSVIAFSLAGFAVGPLMGLFSLRQLTLLGSLFAILGSLWTVFADSQSILIWSQILQSMGSGFLMNTSFTAINNYFVRKRWLFMTLTSVCPSISSMAAPLFLNWSLRYYGQRSTLLLIVGFNLQTLPAACLLQPIDWHMKRVPDDDVPEKEALVSKSTECKSSIKLTEGIKNDKTTLKITINDSPGSTQVTKEDKHIIEKQAVENNADKKNKLRKILEKIFDISLMKNFVIMNACLGLAISLFAHSMYLLLLPMGLEAEDKWDKETVAWAIALLGFGDIAFRFIMLVFSKYFTMVSSRIVYIFGLVIAVLSRLGQLWWVNKIVVMGFIVIAGISQSIITTLIPHIVSELTDQSQFPAAMGTLMLMIGIINIVIGPVVGKIRDLTNSYLTVFYILTSFFAIVALFWCIEMCHANNQKKIKERLKNPLREKNGKGVSAVKKINKQRL